MRLSANIQDPQILLLEDEKQTLDVLSGMLTDDGFSVVSVSSLEQAYAQLEGPHKFFAAQVMDIRMNEEEMDGLDAIGEIQHRKCRPIPAIVVSAFAKDEKYLKKAKDNKLQIQDWIEKPLFDEEHNKLTHHIQALIESAKNVMGELIELYAFWLTSRHEGVQKIRILIQEKARFDPALISQALLYLEETDARDIADFIAQVNFACYEAQLKTMLELHGTGYIAYWKGKMVGFDKEETRLIRAVYQKEKTTDIFFAPLSKERLEMPGGPVVRQRRYLPFNQ